MFLVLCNGDGGGMDPMSVDTDRPLLDPSASSTLYGGCWVTPAIARSTSTVEPIRLTARFICSSDVKVR